MGELVVKKALLIAFHFPPVGFSSGLQRVLSLARQLPEFGWQPLVLTANPRAYEATNDGQMSDIPEETVVERAFALNTRKHLSWGGRYFHFMALPDQWVTWCLGGVFSGIGMIRKYRPSVIWSTYPIASAHLIGLILHKLTGLPWVVDFRDSMTEDHYPSDPTKRKLYRWIEKHTIFACSKAVFTTPSALDMYRLRYPQIPDDRWVLIPNGYDEDVFEEVERELAKKHRHPGQNRKILLHSGLVYPSERNPSQLFQALSFLKREQIVDRCGLVVRLRACGNEKTLRSMLQEYDVEDLVELLPGVPYREALAEVMAADALLILQAGNCNHQVPAKIYEYFRAGRPVLGLTDPVGDTARVMRDAGLDRIVPLDNASAIAEALSDFLRCLEGGTLSVATPDAVQNTSRRHSTELLSDIFEKSINTR